jgi:hypothetical protein
MSLAPHVFLLPKARASFFPSRELTIPARFLPTTRTVVESDVNRRVTGDRWKEEEVRRAVWTNELLELFCSGGVSFFLPEEVIKRDSHSRTPLAFFVSGPVRDTAVLVRVFPASVNVPCCA